MLSAETDVSPETRCVCESRVKPLLRLELRRALGGGFTNNRSSNPVRRLNVRLKTPQTSESLHRPMLCSKNTIFDKLCHK